MKIFFLIGLILFIGCMPKDSVCYPIEQQTDFNTYCDNFHGTLRQLTVYTSSGSLGDKWKDTTWCDCPTKRSLSYRNAESNPCLWEQQCLIR